MQLDQTRIAVRERGLLDNFDLALRVLRRDGLPVAISFAAGAIPLMLLNYLLLGWMMYIADRENFFYLDDAGQIARYIWGMTLLISIEAPLASLLTTSYLGKAMFVRHPHWRALASDVWKMLPRVLWSLVLIRGVLAAWLLLAALERYGDFDPTIEILGLGGLSVYVFALRAWRPFMTEIILLERNPLVSRRTDAVTVSRRSYQLHGPSSGDLIGRSLGVGILAVLLTLAVFGTFVFCDGVFLNDWQPGPLMLNFVLPASMWIVAGFLCVVRFLNYLDLRIRHEGWEVELLMRAEGERIRSRP